MHQKQEFGKRGLIIMWRNS